MLSSWNKGSTGPSGVKALTPRRVNHEPFNELDPYSSSRDTLSDKDRDRDHTIQGGGHVITLSSHAMMTGGANSTAVDLHSPTARLSEAGSEKHDKGLADMGKRDSDGKPHGGPRAISAVAGLAYITTSACLILFNKHALSNFHFGCPNALLFFHCALSVLLVKFCEIGGLLKAPVEPLRWSIMRIWLPANLIFVGMIVSSFFALKLIGVGMFTVLKNLSNLLTMGGDYLFFGRTYGLAVWACVFLMIASAAAGGLTDLHFTWEGYTWQMINCCFTSAYALYLSRAMDRVAPYTTDKNRMNEFSMVYYNNLLSLGPIAVLVLAFGEHTKLLTEPALRNPEFLVVALLGGLLGFAISFTSLWFMARSTATVYSLTGSMNKILVAIVGIVLFHEAASGRNLASIGVGLLAGVVFVFAKAYAGK